VGAARPDGYHHVRTVLQAITLHDTLTFKARSGPFTIVSSEPRIPTDSRNLIWKAAYELSRAAGMTRRRFARSPGSGA
jgi:4-diphosphocytidyl-2-C-methyl-D-erythritol kinase